MSVKIVHPLCSALLEVRILFRFSTIKLVLFVAEHTLTSSVHLHLVLTATRRHQRLLAIHSFFGLRLWPSPTTTSRLTSDLSCRLASPSTLCCRLDSRPARPTAPPTAIPPNYLPSHFRPFSTSRLSLISALPTRQPSCTRCPPP